MAKREDILQMMLEMVAKKGLHSAPMSILAKEAGVATGTIYHHFKSKEAILEEVYLRIKSDFQEIIEQALEKGEGPKAQFTNLWTGIYTYYNSNPSVFKFLQHTNSNTILSPEVRAEGKRRHKAAADFFRRGMEKGLFLKMEVNLMTELTHGNICTAIEFELENEAQMTTTQLENAILFSWKGIQK